MDAKQFINRQLGTAGWAPIHPEVTKLIYPDADNVNIQRDLRIDQQHPEQLLRPFPRTQLCLARIDGFGIVPILYRSPLVLAERIAFLTGGTVEIVGEEDAPQASIVQIIKPESTDPLVLRFANVATKEPPRSCKLCGNLSSAQTCMAAGEINAPSGYRPGVGEPRRCLAYKPPGVDRDEILRYDRRTGVQLWPECVAVDELQADGESAIGKAAALLSDLLKDGQCNAAEIRAAAEGANISERTLQRAADQLGVVKSKAGFAGGWIWAMPMDEAA